MYMNIINGHTTDDTYIARGRIMLGVMTTIHCTNRTGVAVVGKGLKNYLINAHTNVYVNLRTRRLKDYRRKKKGKKDLLLDVIHNT